MRKSCMFAITKSSIHNIARNKLLYILDELRVSTFSFFGVNYSFKTWCDKTENIGLEKPKVIL